MRFLFFIWVCLFSLAMANNAEETGVYIVYVQTPQGVTAENVEAFHLETLASVVGSEEAARSALLYSYKTAAHGFSAKLTPSQATAMADKPGVLQVMPSQTLQLHQNKMTIA